MLRFLMVIAFAVPAVAFADSLVIPSGKLGDSVSLIPFQTVIVELRTDPVQNSDIRFQNTPSASLEDLKVAVRGADITFSRNVMWIVGNSVPDDLLSQQIPEGNPAIHESLATALSGRFENFRSTQKKYYFGVGAGPATPFKFVKETLIELNGDEAMFSSLIDNLLDDLPNYNILVQVYPTAVFERGHLNMPVEIWDAGYEYIALVSFEYIGNRPGEDISDARLRRLAHVLMNEEVAFQLFYDPENMLRALVEGDSNAGKALQIHPHGTQVFRSLLERATPAERAIVIPWKRATLRGRYWAGAEERELEQLLSTQELPAAVRYKGIEHLAYTGRDVGQAIQDELQKDTAEESIGDLIDAAAIIASDAGKKELVEQIKQIRRDTDAGSKERTEALRGVARLLPPKQ